jgi:radical SAM protein with 4Fe4S-binding SPASM domain
VADHFPEEYLFNILKSVNKLGINKVSLTGGEPLLHPNILSILEIASKNKLEIRLQSNGILLNNYLDDITVRGVKDVLVSIDGLKSYHDNFRGYSGLFELCISAIKDLIKRKITVRVNSAICRSNVSQIQQLTDYLEQLGVSCHSYFYLSPYGRGESLRPFVLSPEEWYDFYVMTINSNHNRKIKIKIQKAYLGIDDKNERLCRILLKNNIHIDIKGDVYPCVFLKDSKYSLGNLEKNSLNNILQNKQTWDILIKKIVKKECYFKTTCSLGCIGISIMEGNNYKNCDSRCHNKVIPACIRSYHEI